MVGCRVLYRRSDGGLYNPDEDRRIEVDELREEVRVGHRFWVYQQETGADCTMQVLVEILISALQGYGYSAPAEPVTALLNALSTHVAAEGQPPLDRRMGR